MKDDKIRPMTDKQRKRLISLGWAPLTVHEAAREINKLLQDQKIGDTSRRNVRAPWREKKK